MSDMYRLPEDGQSADRVLSDIKQLKAAMTARDRGRLSSTAFQGAAVGGELVRQAYTEFLEWNALFSFQEAPAAKLESDVLDMCIALAGGDSTARGNLTSGGTESNFCALAAMRSWAREAYPQIVKPNVVAPYSTHATVHKVARYLDIQVVTVPQRQDLTADVDALAQVVDENTIGIVASAPNWPYGHVDPIEQLGTLALERGIWLHVDACVGGYVLPFMRELGEDIPAYDLSVPGVRSLSADLHKYGYAPKPLSSVLWASQVEQAYHYMPITEWACGLYLSQSFVGSRPLAPVAAAWAMMHFWGRQGYLDNARQLLDLKARLQTACDEIDGIRSWPTQGPLMMIASGVITSRVM